MSVAPSTLAIGRRLPNAWDLAAILCVFGVLVAAGVRARWTVGLLVLAVLVAILAIKGGVLHGYQLDRFRSFTDPHGVQHTV